MSYTQSAQAQSAKTHDVVEAEALREGVDLRVYSIQKSTKIVAITAPNRYHGVLRAELVAVLRVDVDADAPEELKQHEHTRACVSTEETERMAL